jgi:hypothetical protein
MVDFETRGGFSEVYTDGQETYEFERESYKVNGEFVDISRIKSEGEILASKTESGDEELSTSGYESWKDKLQDVREQGSWDDANQELEKNYAAGGGL